MQVPWPWWRLLTFRFFFIYFLLFVAPWNWLSAIPGVGSVIGYIDDALDWLTIKISSFFFGIQPLVQPPNGSGDTSMSWAALATMLLLAAVGMLIWTAAQWHKKTYPFLDYWLRLGVRYYIITICFGYGIIKLFGMQMPFPNYSQMITPLGDFLPMRLSWMFLGYSAPYQAFSGLMEVFAGALLLWRRTATLGALVALGVFINVAMLNFSYDIPVKIFSMQMVLACTFLLAYEWNRIVCFFLLNKPACACSIYERKFLLKRSKAGRWLLKAAFILLVVGFTFYQSYSQYKTVALRSKNMPLQAGVWTVTQYVRNSDTLPPLLTDSLRWQNIVFDDNSSGSIATSDTSFRRRYNRAYFVYETDTVKHKMEWFKRMGDTAAMASLNYQFINPQTVAFTGRLREDSVYFVLAKSGRLFQLAERQFHWLSEANR